MFVLRVTQALSRARVPHALAGGHAVALHGAVRGTVDVDLVLRFRERDFARAAASLESLGLRSRLPLTAADVFRYREEYIRNRNLMAWTFVNPAVPSEIVDILLVEDLAAVKVVTIRAGGQALRVVSIGDLIRMKRAAGRPQDLEDVSALERLA